MNPTPPTDYWVHNLSPFIFRFPDGWFVEGLRWYGMSYVAGFIAAWLLIRLYATRGKVDWTPDQQINLLTAIILGVAIGGRLGYMLFYNLGDFLANPLVFFAFTRGGMASHGGFIGVTIACIWFCRHYRQSFAATADVLATVAAPGLFFGRIANFINGELWGKISDVSWAVIFPHSEPWVHVSEIPPRHPSQLYEAVGEGLLLFLYMQWRFWCKPPKHKGVIAGEFLALYAVARIVCEQFREPDAPLIAGLSRGSFLSVGLFAAGVAIIFAARRQGSRL